MPRFSEVKMVVPLEENLLAVVNIFTPAFYYSHEEFVRLGFTWPFLSWTSRLQTWNQPRQKKKTYSKTIKYERAEYGKVKKAHPKPFPIVNS